MKGAYLSFGCGLILVLGATVPFARESAESSAGKTVKVAVIGGMTMTPLWGELQRQFEADTGIKVQVVATGEKTILANAMKEGKVDFLTMHSSDATTNLVADGWARDIRPWAKNDLVIVGHVNDPAGNLRDAERFGCSEENCRGKGKLARLFQSNGPRETAHTLFANARVNMIGPWVLKYENTVTREILHYVASKNAYMLVGRIPVVFKKWDPDPNVKIMVQGDPNMRRPYMEMIANPDRFTDANVEGAKKLADYLLSAKIQKFLATYDGGVGDGIPIFIPVNQPRPTTGK